MFELKTTFMTLTWILQFFFWFSLIPQVIMNVKMHSTSGLSSITLWGYFTAYTASSLYAFCLNLPLAYKVIDPICLLTVIFMIGQQILYEKKLDLAWEYAITILCTIVSIPLAISNPIYIGNLFGWASTIIWMTYQIPQMLKIHSEKSVVGLSFALIALVGIGNFLEMLTSFALQFPIQSTITTIRGTFFSIILVMQYFIYHNPTKIFR
jgi:uncharacterized protein with PQ loop repeat